MSTGGIGLRCLLMAECNHSETEVKSLDKSIFLDIPYVQLN